MKFRVWMTTGAAVAAFACSGGDQGSVPATDAGADAPITAPNDANSAQGEVEMGPTSAADMDPSSGADARNDMPEDTPSRRVTTALVVESDPDGNASQYGVVELATDDDGAEARTGEPVAFGDGHLHVNASDRGVFVIDSRNGVVRVLEIDENPGSDDYRHVTDIDLQTAEDGAFGVRPQWVGHHEGTGSLIISEFGKGSLAKVPLDWTSGDVGPVVHVDLSSFDEEDGNPEPTIVLVDGDYALVSLQRFGADYQPTKESQMLVWHIGAETVANVVDLPGMNFHAGMKWGPGGDVYAGLAGVIGTADQPVLDGGIVRIRRQQEGSYAPDPEFLVSEADLNGDLWGFVLTSESTGYAVVRTANGRQLVEFEVGESTTFTPISGVATPSGWMELADEPGQLWVADLGGENPAAAGMRVLDLDEQNGMLNHEKLGFEGRPTSFAITNFHVTVPE